MQSLSNHTVGSRPCDWTNDALHAFRASHFGPASSCHECDINASQQPRVMALEREYNSEFGVLSSTSSKVIQSNVTHRNCVLACLYTILGSPGPMAQAMLAAARVAPVVSTHRRSWLCVQYSSRWSNTKYSKIPGGTADAIGTTIPWSPSVNITNPDINAWKVVMVAYTARWRHSQVFIASGSRRVMAHAATPMHTAALAMYSVCMTLSDHDAACHP
mmetsp:Transcript_40270/g.121719  ORF Transcript_40270/g.121719 Transcript_40270/m.121719 type:complete len:217 (+) Transcript_40270:324-974(+)